MKKMGLRVDDAFWSAGLRGGIFVCCCYVCGMVRCNRRRGLEICRRRRDHLRPL